MPVRTPQPEIAHDLELDSTFALAWRKLHRLAYVATALGAIHFVWLVKAWPPEPLIYAGIVILLLAYRTLPARVRRARRLAVA